MRSTGFCSRFIPSNYRHFTEAEKRGAAVLGFAGEGQTAPGCFLCFALKLLKCLTRCEYLQKMMTLKGQTQVISNNIAGAVNRTFLPLLLYKH